MILDILHVLVNLLWWIVFLQAIMSILIAFNVINTYNEIVRSIWNTLQAITDPIYRPVRRVLPAFNGIDLSPFVVLVVLMILSTVVIPRLQAWYMGVSPL